MSQNFVEIAGVGECVQAVDAAEMSEGALIASAAEWKEAGLLLTSDGLARASKLARWREVAVIREAFGMFSEKISLLVGAVSLVMRKVRQTNINDVTDSLVTVRR